MLTDRKIALITFGIALLSIPILAGAQPDTLKLSLDDARKMAIEQNTNVRNSAIDLEIAKKKVWETSNWPIQFYPIRNLNKYNKKQFKS